MVDDQFPAHRNEIQMTIAWTRLFRNEGLVWMGSSKRVQSFEECASMLAGVDCRRFLAAVSLLPILIFSGAWAGAAESPTSGETFTAMPAGREVTLTGYTRARSQMEIVSEEPGRCLNVQADLGDRIGPDGVFAELDPTFIDLAMKQNRVARDRLRNQIAYFDKDVRRYTELVGRAAAAQATLDGVRQQKDQAAFQLQAIEVERENLEERRRRLSITVPAGWTVSERLLEPGAWVPVGRPLGQAGDYRTLLVPFALAPEEYQALLRERERLVLLFPDEGTKGASVPAVLERTSPAFDGVTRKIGVDLAVRGGLKELRGGLRAELTLHLADSSGTLLVPASALVERYEEYWLVRTDGERVKVVYLGKGPDGTARIRASRVRADDRFQLTPQW